jgi:hypothetical protein
MKKGLLVTRSVVFINRATKEVHFNVARWIRPQSEARPLGRADDSPSAASPNEPHGNTEVPPRLSLPVLLRS